MTRYIHCEFKNKISQFWKVFPGFWIKDVSIQAGVSCSDLEVRSEGRMSDVLGKKQNKMIEFPGFVNKNIGCPLKFDFQRNTRFSNIIYFSVMCVFLCGCVCHVGVGVCKV